MSRILIEYECPVHGINKWETDEFDIPEMVVCTEKGSAYDICANDAYRVYAPSSISMPCPPKGEAYYFAVISGLAEGEIGIVYNPATGEHELYAKSKRAFAQLSRVQLSIRAKYNT